MIPARPHGTQVCRNQGLASTQIKMVTSESRQVHHSAIRLTFTRTPRSVARTPALTRGAGRRHNSHRGAGMTRSQRIVASSVALAILVTATPASANPAGRYIARWVVWVFRIGRRSPRIHLPKAFPSRPGFVPGSRLPAHASDLARPPTPSGQLAAGLEAKAAGEGKVLVFDAHGNPVSFADDLAHQDQTLIRNHLHAFEQDLAVQSQGSSAKELSSALSSDTLKRKYDYEFNITSGKVTLSVTTAGGQAKVKAEFNAYLIGAAALAATHENSRQNVLRLMRALEEELDEGSGDHTNHDTELADAPPLPTPSVTPPTQESKPPGLNAAGNGTAQAPTRVEP
jgi:hypothetical protein